MQFTIWLTYDCNLQCTYCYEGNNKPSGKMSLETANEVSDFIYKQITIEKSIDDYVSIDFLGGEPLLNYETMCYLIEKIRSWDIKMPIFLGTTTNAVLLTKDKIIYLMKMLDEISLSIDGKKLTHDMHRKNHDGSGSYKTIISNINEILSCENWISKIRVRMTVSPTTVNYLYENVDYLVGLGFKTIVPMIDRFVDWPEEESNCLYQEMIKIHEGIAIKQNDLKLGLVDDISLRQESFCLAGEETMHISPDGIIFPCTYVVGQDDFIFGDVRKGIKSEKVEWLKNINSAKMTDCCMSCAWKRLCIGNRCRLLNFAATGNFYTPSYATCINERLHLKLCGQAKSR